MGAPGASHLGTRETTNPNLPKSSQAPQSRVPPLPLIWRPGCPPLLCIKLPSIPAQSRNETPLLHLDHRQAREHDPAVRPAFAQTCIRRVHPLPPYPPVTRTYRTSKQYISELTHYL